MFYRTLDKKTQTFQGLCPLTPTGGPTALPRPPPTIFCATDTPVFVLQKTDAPLFVLYYPLDKDLRHERINVWCPQKGRTYLNKPAAENFKFY